MHDVGLGRGERSVGVSETLTVTLWWCEDLCEHTRFLAHLIVTLSTGVC